MKTLGQTEDTRRLGSGSLLVHTSIHQQSDIVLHLSQMSGVPVRVLPHELLNCCKGVVLFHESALCSDQELCDWLSEQGITDFRRLSTRFDSTQLLVLTFAGTQLPRRVCWCLSGVVSDTTFPTHDVVSSASIMAMSIAPVPILLFVPNVARLSMNIPETSLAPYHRIVLTVERLIQLLPAVVLDGSLKRKFNV